MPTSPATGRRRSRPATRARRRVGAAAAIARDGVVIATAISEPGKTSTRPATTAPHQRRLADRRPQASPARRPRSLVRYYTAAALSATATRTCAEAPTASCARDWDALGRASGSHSVPSRASSSPRGAAAVPAATRRPTWTQPSRAVPAGLARHRRGRAGTRAAAAGARGVPGRERDRPRRPPGDAVARRALDDHAGADARAVRRGAGGQGVRRRGRGAGRRPRARAPAARLPQRPPAGARGPRRESGRVHAPAGRQPRLRPDRRSRSAASELH